MREAAIQNIVEGTAREQLRMTEKHNTRPAAQTLQLQVGDQVELWRKPPHKDVPGWRGPARVVDCTPETMEHGTVGVNWQGRSMSARIADLRKALTYMVMSWFSMRDPECGNTLKQGLIRGKQVTSVKVTAQGVIV